MSPDANHKKIASKLFANSNCDKNFSQFARLAKDIPRLFKIIHRAITLTQDESEVDNANPACASGQTKIKLKTIFTPREIMEMVTGVRISCLA